MTGMLANGTPCSSPQATAKRLCERALLAREDYFLSRDLLL